MANTKKTAAKRSTCCGSKKSNSDVSSVGSTTKTASKSRTVGKKSGSVK